MAATRVLTLLIGSLLAATPVLATAATAAASATTADRVETVLIMQVDGDIVIEKDGSVGSYSLTTPLTAALTAPLDKSIRAWKFTPVLVDGVLVRAETRMRISLVATQAGKDDYQVRIENVVFPSSVGKDATKRPEAVSFLAAKMRPPLYPRGLERAGITGRVLLGLRFAPDGKVQEVVPVQTMLFDIAGADRALAKAIRMLEDSALQAARHWTATVQVREGATPDLKQLTAFTTVEYVLDPRPRSEKAAKEAEAAREAPNRQGKWRQVSRTPKRAMPWLAGEKDLQDVGVADLGGGEMLPLAGAPQLLSPVGGSL